MSWLRTMDYNFLKEKVVEHLKLDAVYFPFEYIRGYKHLLSMQEQVPIPDNVKEEYFTLFKCAKEQCEILLKTEPNHEDVELWQEAIDEINKIIN